MKAFDLGFEVLPRFVGRMRGWTWGGYYLDIGTQDSLKRAERDARESSPGTSFRRNVQLPGSPPSFLTVTAL